MRRNRPQPERGSVTRSNLRTPMALSLSLAAAIALSGCVAPSSSEVDSMEAGQRAIHYLSREVAAWNPEHNCFSCHNNGDGAAALIVGAYPHEERDRAALAGSIEWLSKPQNWHENKGDPEFSDFKLARIQFGAALLAATELHLITNKEPLIEAARQIALDQETDGSWKIEADNSPGSPVTYGNALATARVVEILSLADKALYSRQIAAARQWLGEFPIHNTTSAAGVLLGLNSPEAFHLNDAYAQSRETAARFLLRAQSNANGGWGPFPNSPPEPFDTAAALIALTSPPSASLPEVRRAIAAGRAYLLSSQFEEGGWPETTRPAGEQSYAQHISTTAWCLMALTLSADEISVQLIGQP